MDKSQLTLILKENKTLSDEAIKKIVQDNGFTLRSITHSPVNQNKQ